MFLKTLVNFYHQILLNKLPQSLKLWGSKIPLYSTYELISDTPDTEPFVSIIKI